MSDLSRTVVEWDGSPKSGTESSPFLCEFCEDIKIASNGHFDMQAEIDICSRCMRIDRSVRFSDFLLVQ